MNKIIILLSLIYFISCYIVCRNGLYLPEKKEDCFNRTLEDHNDDICCFLRIYDSSIGNMTLCGEYEKRINIGFTRLQLASKYARLNYTLEEFSFPNTQKYDDSSKEDDSSSNVCDNQIEAQNYKNCFSKTLADDKNDFCCFGTFSVDGKSYNGCLELNKNIPFETLKKELDSQASLYEMKLEGLECPPIEKEEKEEKENSSQGNSSNNGFYIKFGFVLIIVFLF